MDRQEFIDWMHASWENFLKFNDTFYVDDAAYNQCKLCGFKTKKVKVYNSDALDAIDNQSIMHLLGEKHIGEVPKLYYEYRSKQIALKKGQTTLEV